MKIALLNTTIATTDGTYVLKTITLDEAKNLVQCNENLDSAIGHQSTADVMTVLLGVTIPVNRQQFAQKIGQQALVFKLKGRPPEGVILSAVQIEEIGYEFKVLTREA